MSGEVWVYPPEQVVERWEDEAERMDMSMSKFVQAMVEAGLKKFGPEVQPDETNLELRKHRNELVNELERTRNRVETLEELAYNSERAEIEEWVSKNPGIKYAGITERVGDTVAGRVTSHLEDMAGRTLVKDAEERYYPKEGDE